MTAALTDRQERFVFEYLIDQNARAAARRAGYADSTRGAHAAALMKNPLVRERICIELQGLYAESRVTALSILKAQARIAFFDPRKMFGKDGAPLPMDQLDDDTAAVLLVHHDERANGDWVRRVRQPARHLALAALEKRYAQFMQMQMELLRMPGGDGVEEEATEWAGADCAAPVDQPRQPGAACDAVSSTASPTATSPVSFPAAATSAAAFTPVPPMVPAAAAASRVVGTAARSAAGPNPRLGIVQAPQPPRAQFAPSRLADLVHRAVMQSERPAVPRRPDHPLAGHDLALAA